MLVYRRGKMDARTYGCDANSNYYEWNTIEGHRGAGENALVFFRLSLEISNGWPWLTARREEISDRYHLPSEVLLTSNW